MSGRTLPESLGHFLLLFSLLTATGFSADSGMPPKISTTLQSKQRFEEEKFAAERLAFWQRRLGLDDWTVTVIVARVNDLRPDTLGNVHWDTVKKTAQIRVLDAADYAKPFPDVLRDVETTIVHELVHLELACIPRNEASLTPEEQAVVRITEALLRLGRSE